MTDTDTTTTLTPEQEDVLRHAFAAGTVAIRAVADIATVIGIEGRPMTSEELSLIRDKLHQVFRLLYNSTISKVGRDVPCEYPEWETQRDRYQDHYSDGEPVVSIIRSAVLGPKRRLGYSRESWPESRDGFHYCGDLWWNPCVTIEVEDVDMSPGTPPAGLEVVVHETPATKGYEAWLAADKVANPNKYRH